MKICPVRAELFHADGRMDRQTSMTQMKVVFRNFSKAPETVSREGEEIYMYV
jgi:hypothetical protein